MKAVTMVASSAAHLVVVKADHLVVLSVVL